MSELATIYMAIFIAMFPAMWIAVFILDRIWPSNSERDARPGEPELTELVQDPNPRCSTVAGA